MKKIVTYLMLISLLVNFLTPLYVNALTSGDVYNYINNTKTVLSEIKEKINNKKTIPNYQNDVSFKFSVDYIEKNLNQYENSLIEQENVLDNKISLYYLINTYFPDKKDIYESFFQEDQLIDINNITDITYEEELVTKTFLTKDEITSVVINNYLKELNDLIINYNNNFDNNIVIYQNKYNNLNDRIDEIKSTIVSFKSSINSYKENELLLNNNPNMVIDNKDVITLLDEQLEELNNIPIVTISNIDEVNLDVENIFVNGNKIYNTFNENNKNYIELGLDEKINNLNDSYIEIEKNIDTTNYYNLDNISLYIDIINNDLLLNTLNEEINSYLERRPSDTINISLLMENIDRITNNYNKSNALKLLEEMVDNTSLNNENNVDKLYVLLDEDINEITKDKIINAKLSFYKFDLKDKTKYNFKLNKDNYILESLEKINKEDFINNIDYEYKFVIKEENDFITSNTLIELYDKNDMLYYTYKVSIKGDINLDCIVDNNDLENLKNSILNEEELTDLVKLDFNDDKKIDFNDLVSLKNYITNPSEVGISTYAYYVITKTNENNKLYYTITLKTDGKVTDLMFNINTSDNLSFDSILNINDKISLNNQENPTKLIGLEEFYDEEELITICYTDTKNLEEDILFNILNSINYLDSKEIIMISEISNVTPKKIITNEIEKSENKVIYVSYPIDDETYNKNDEKENQTIVDNDKQDNQDNQEDNKLLISNVIKIVIIVLLGTLIVYYMNKNETEEEKDISLDSSKK